MMVLLEFAGVSQGLGKCQSLFVITNLFLMNLCLIVNVEALMINVEQSLHSNTRHDCKIRGIKQLNLRCQKIKTNNTNKCKTMKRSDAKTITVL